MKWQMLYFYIYYSGHSAIGTSNLIAEQEKDSKPNEVTFKEVLDTIEKSGFNKTVDIWIDSCFSSEHCFSARSLMKTGNYSFELKV